MTSEEIARYRWQEALRRNRIDTLRKLGKASGDKLEIDTNNSHFRLSRVVDTAEIAKLERMAIVHELQAEEAHESTVQCLQFSPDGRSLVTSRYYSSWIQNDIADCFAFCLIVLIGARLFSP